jgi:hypothetical protein
MSKAYTLARVDLRWVFTRLIVLGVLIVAAWFGGYYFSMLVGKHEVPVGPFAQETLNQSQLTPTNASKPLANAF